MEYSNPKIPEHINTTKEHPLKEFFFLIVGVISLIIITVFVLGLLAERLVVYIPFSTEQEIAASYMADVKQDNIQSVYLQGLADDLAREINIDAEVSITVHYLDDDLQNAFAMIGGHIFVHGGLVRMIPNENALAMVIAHEIAHVHHRHPLTALGRGILVGLFLATVTGVGNDRVAAQIISETGLITVLRFSRDQEIQADETALNAIASYYGHVSGADDLFKTLIKIEENNELGTPEFLSTHPLNTDRINNLVQITKRNSWSRDNQTTPLPDIF